MKSAAANNKQAKGNSKRREINTMNDLERTMKRRQEKVGNAVQVKGVLQSVTLWGVLLALASRFAGVEMTVQDGQAMTGQALAAWPLVLALFADLKVAWGRVAATSFNKSWWRSGNFWAVCFGAVMSVLAALGVNWGGLEALPEKIAAVVMVVGSLLGAVLQWVGRARASKTIQVGGAAVLGITAFGFDFEKLIRPIRSAFSRYFRAKISKLGELDGRPGFSYGDVQVMMGWVVAAQATGMKNQQKHEQVLKQVLTRFGEAGTGALAAWAAPLVVNYVYELARNTRVLKKN